MAKANPTLIAALRAAADKIAQNSDYQWGHMGACNCGNLAQVVTLQSKAEIHKRAMYGIGDWNEQLRDFCPTSGLPFDEVVSQLLDLGFDLQDLQRLEKLSDPRVLARLEFKTTLRHNVKEDVVLYFHLWADLLESEWQIQQKQAAQPVRQHLAHA